jgi:hypothetical protein
MSGSRPGRLGMVLGLTVAAAAATWWLAATQLALRQTMSTAAIAASLLTGLWLARATLLAPFALRAGAVGGWRHATSAALAIVVAAWPVVLAAASAGARPVMGVVLGEAALLAVAVALPSVGHGLRTVLRSSRTALLACTVLGGALSAALWMWGTVWTGVNG